MKWDFKMVVFIVWWS